MSDIGESGTVGLLNPAPVCVIEVPRVGADAACVAAACSKTP